MSPPTCVLFVPTVVLGLVLADARPGYSLTVYRIGDTGDSICQDANVRCFDWFEVTEADNFGLTKGVSAPQGFLQPEMLDTDTNLSPLIRDREHGWIKSASYSGWKDEGRAQGTGLNFLFDGDESTAYFGLKGDKFSAGCGNFMEGSSEQCKAIWFKFGGLFPIDRVVFYPTPEFAAERFISSFRIGTSDAPVERTLSDMGRNPNLRDREGYLKWGSGVTNFADFDIVYEFRENTQVHLDLSMPDEPISEIFFVGVPGNWDIAEFEIYGAGYTAEASYVTELIPLDGPSSLGALSWSGGAPEGTRLDLSMRTGDDASPEVYWRWDRNRGGARSRLNEDGTPLTRFDYYGGGPDNKEKLSDADKAGVSPDKDSWEPWSPPLNLEDLRADLVGRKPRRYVQLRADFTSTVAAAGGRLDYLQFEVSTPPVASQVLAEIVPLRAPLGETTEFTYKVTPTITAGVDLTFDSIQIFTQTAPVSVDSVRFERFALGPGEFTLAPYEVDGESFTVQLPEGVAFVDQEVIDVVFQAAVFRASTVFDAKVFNSAMPDEVRQRVTVGDADPLFDSSSLSVFATELGVSVVAALRASALTPNSDGANDVLHIEYDLVNLDGDVPLTLSVFTLAGDLVTDIHATAPGSGRFHASWDGVGRGGDLVPPGLYVLRVEVDSDRETVAALTTFPVIY